MSDKRKARPELTHPLCGADLNTLTRVLFGSGPLDPRRLPQATIALLAALARWPFSAVERVRVARRLDAQGPIQPPLFILGHWRSGTTHLYNVMSRDPGLGWVPPVATGLPWDLLGIATWLRPMLEKQLPETRYIDNIPVHPDSPQEDEIALANMTPLSFYHGLYFPRRLQERFDRGIFFDGCSGHEIEAWTERHVYLIRKLALTFEGRRMMIKNPVYTARLQHLRATWPGARFVHIHRNPYTVFLSTRNFWVRLFEQFALQRPPAGPLDDFILDAYARMMDIYYREAAAVPASELIELRFETFETDPVGHLERIYAELGLDGFEAARPRFEAYLGTIRGYRKNAYDWPPALLAKVRDRLGPLLERWGYDVPKAA